MNTDTDHPAVMPMDFRSAKPWAGLLSFLAINLLVGVAGGWLTAQSVSTWYQSIAKPSLTPPDWVFGPVWTLLYIMMAVAAWWIWVKAGSLAGCAEAMTLYAVQLMFNLAWSFLFFTLQSPLYALIDIIVLWIAIATMMYHFFKWSNLSGALIVPYLLWVSYATALNLQIVRMN